MRSAENMTEKMVDLYQQFSKPLLTKLMKLIKVDRVYVKASGNRLEDSDGGVVTDFLGGFGSTLLGHNHPELLKVIQQSYSENIPTHVQASVRADAARLASRVQDELNLSYPACPQFVTHLCNTGTEAVEAVIKHFLMVHAEKKQIMIDRLEQEIASQFYQTKNQEKVVAEKNLKIKKLREQVSVLFALKGSYHGKTAGALSVTSNPKFKSMYDAEAVEVRFLDPNDISSCEVMLEDAMPNCIGILFEPIQCEGGIRVLPPEFFSFLKKAQTEYEVPLIADEIQTGMFRTGKFLALEWNQLLPDAFLLGKSLGGGLCKISSLSIKKAKYSEEFSVIHSSTFAEDELSCRVAIRTFDLVKELNPNIGERAQAFEKRIFKLVKEAQGKYGSFLKAVSGKGFLIGLEFDFVGKVSVPPLFLKMVHDTGFGSYLFMSYFLNQHGIRVGVTLSRPEVLRLEPSALIEDADLAKFEKALLELCELIQERKFLKITQHLWRDDLSEESLNFVSPPLKRVFPKEGVRNIAFASHLIEERHILLLDPLFIKLSREERHRFLKKFSEVADSGVYHEQMIRGENGAEVRLMSIGSFRTTNFYENSHKNKDHQAVAVVREMVARAKKEGADLIGLGQYTSIVTESGVLLKDENISITSGNSLTAGLAYLALLKLLEEKGKKLNQVKIGIVGANGNICNALAQILGDDVKEMVLVFRESDTVAEKQAWSKKGILSSSKITEEQLIFTTDLNALKDCDAVLLGTNTVEVFLHSEHLKENAVVVDISVPSNVDPVILETRKDVRAIQGGLAILPLGQDLETEWMPLPRGQIYACLAETIVLALSGHQGHYSIGPISKNQVLDILARAEKVGVKLGALLPLQTRKEQR